MILFFTKKYFEVTHLTKKNKIAIFSLNSQFINKSLNVCIQKF